MLKRIWRRILFVCCFYGRLVQLDLERSPTKREVAGSSPASAFIFSLQTNEVNGKARLKFNKQRAHVFGTWTKVQIFSRPVSLSIEKSLLAGNSVWSECRSVKSEVAGSNPAPSVELHIAKCGLRILIRKIVLFVLLNSKFAIRISQLFGLVAKQSLRHRTFNPGIVGSNPTQLI